MSKKTMKFKTEVSQLLDLVIHSLYSNKEIFIRELVSNSSDAIDKIRLEGLKDRAILEGDENFKIKINFSSDANTITISDNGIGMNYDELINNIGTIAKSGTKEFINKLKEMKEKGEDKSEAELIGQFGVGFYSAFMVSDKIEITTRKAGEKEAWKWISDGKEKFSIEETEKEERGTQITLYLTSEHTEFASEWKIKDVVKKYSDYISYPVTMDVEREEKPKDKDGKIIEDAEAIKTIEEETLNSQKAIWKKDKKEVTDEEYNDFYKHISHDYTEPLDKLHISVEGMLDYKALLYIPKKAPFDMYMREAKIGVSLYVKNVFIMDDCKHLLPEYLRFVKGVVDSSDLPLNVSREILQEDKLLDKIQKNLVKKILDTLAKLKKNENEKYLEFYAEFGKALKEGIYSDFTNKDKLAKLTLFESSKTEAGKYTDLEEYVKNMPEGQKDIYYITGESRQAVENSPHLEKFKKKGYEVLFFIDPIDEFITGNFTEFDGKQIKSIGKGEIEFEETEEEKKVKEEQKKTYGSLTENIKETLKDDIEEVRVSSRLIDSPACLVAKEGGMTPQMEKLMKAMNQEMPAEKRILEINPDHKLLKIMNDLYDRDKEDPKIAEYSELLFNQALLAEGSQIKDPVKFAKQVSELMVFQGEKELN